MRLLKLIGLGIAIWSMSLLWLEVNLLLTPMVMIILMIGLTAVFLAYFLGHQFGQYERVDCSSGWPTEPTRPTRTGLTRSHHSRPTLPVRPDQMQKHHSQPTRPMSVS